MHGLGPIPPWPPGPWPYPQQQAPLGHDPLTIHGMEITALKERADKHGSEIDALAARLKALEALKDVVRRYGLWALTSLISVLGHFNKEPLVQKIVGLLEVLAKAMKG